MDNRTFAALKASIEKWERMIAGEPEGDCPLCEMFAKGRGVDQCKGCPVAERAGQIGCYNTPYYDVPELSDDERQDPAQYAAYIAAAQVELDFLRSLLPTA